MEHIRGMTYINADDHAVVIGGSIAGLLAARVLSETFAHVTVVDRDEMPTRPVHRKGVPQSRHTHGLLARGYQLFEELLPGFGADLIARGALTTDMQNDVIWHNEGHELRRAASDMDGLFASRPLIESYVRSRVAALEPVRILAGTEAVGLRDQDGRIAAVRVTGPSGTEELRARVVVDA